MKIMKRYLTSLLVIPVLVSVLLSGCGTDSQQRIAKLEQQVAALTKQAQELSNENRLEPNVIEKDIEIPNSAMNYYWLPFYLTAGDRVEGEVSITVYNTLLSGNRLSGKVEDPYGNILVETSHLGFKANGQAVNDFPRVNPWRFAFIASTDGEYKLGVSFPTGVVNPPAASVAHLKIVHYTGN